MNLVCAFPAILGFLLPLFAGAQAPSTIRIEMAEYFFRPATIHLIGGRPARLVLVNRGQIAHQFETAYLQALSVRIVSDPLEVEATGLGFVRLDPGGVARLEFVPRRTGRFVFFCGIEGHREAGMQGFVQVR